jgi:uncharacterized membrane protein YgdD (TMEM256/DUF423 family)
VNKAFVLVSGLLGASGVFLGAVTQHILKESGSGASAAVADTAVRYQLIHAVVVMAIGLNTQSDTVAAVRRAGWVLIAGTILFSGTLYLRAFTGISGFGLVTMSGGLLLIVGWLLIGFSVLAVNRRPAGTV